jgi:hypothetical protein
MQLAIQRSIDPRIHEILPYTYPPVTAIALIPLGRLSFRTAYAVMTVVNLLLLGLSLKILIMQLELTRAQSLWLILSCLCSFGVHSVILQGQVSFIPLILLTLFIASVQNQRWIATGLTTALVFIKPQLQGAPFLILLGRRMWRALVLASIGVIALVIVSVYAVSWSGIEQYFSLLRTYLTVEHGYGSYPEAMHNLRALSQFLVGFTWSRYLWIALASAVIGAVILLNKPFYNDDKHIGLQWIGNFAAGILLAPHLYPQDLAIAIVPTAVALKLAGEPVPIWLISLLMFLGIYPLLGVVFANRLLPMVPITLLGIVFWCAWSVRPRTNGSPRITDALDVFRVER